MPLSLVSTAGISQSQCQVVVQQSWPAAVCHSLIGSGVVPAWECPCLEGVVTISPSSLYWGHQATRRSCANTWIAQGCMHLLPVQIWQHFLGTDPWGSGFMGEAGLDGAPSVRSHALKVGMCGRCGHLALLDGPTSAHKLFGCCVPSNTAVHLNGCSCWLVSSICCFC